MAYFEKPLFSRMGSEKWQYVKEFDSAKFVTWLTLHSHFTVCAHLLIFVRVVTVHSSHTHTHTHRNSDVVFIRIEILRQTLAFWFDHIECLGSGVENCFCDSQHVKLHQKNVFIRMFIMIQLPQFLNWTTKHCYAEFWIYSIHTSFTYSKKWLT